jgi:hypothetical protein
MLKTIMMKVPRRFLQVLQDELLEMQRLDELVTTTQRLPNRGRWTAASMQVRAMPAARVTDSGACIAGIGTVDIDRACLICQPCAFAVVRDRSSISQNRQKTRRCAVVRRRRPVRAAVPSLFVVFVVLLVGIVVVDSQTLVLSSVLLASDANRRRWVRRQLRRARDD